MWCVTGHCMWLLCVQVMPAGIQQSGVCDCSVYRWCRQVIQQSGVCDCCVYRWCRQVYSSQVCVIAACTGDASRYTAVRCWWHCDASHHFTDEPTAAQPAFGTYHFVSLVSVIQSIVSLTYACMQVYSRHIAGGNSPINSKFPPPRNLTVWSVDSQKNY